MKKQKILIVDDSKPMLCLLEAILGKKYNVFVAINGFEAMSWLREGNKPDLIISDLQMPYIDGLELIAFLAQSSYYEGIPILILSGADEEDIRDKHQQLKVSGYIMKPFDPNELLNKVNETLAGVRQSFGDSFLFI